MQELNRQKGFTIIEVLVATLVIGVLLAIAIPESQKMLANGKIRTVATGVKDGLLQARSEALKRNARVLFTLVSSVGGGYRISLSDGTVLLTNTASSNSSVEVSVPNGGTIVTFNSLGRVVTNTDASATPNQFNVDDNNLTDADTKDLRVFVRTPSGDIRMCDPNVTSASDPRFCA